MQSILPQKSGMSPELALDSPQLSVCEEAPQKIIAVQRGHLQPCCETLTRDTRGLSKSLCMLAKREREREREKEREAERGRKRGGWRPTWAERERQTWQHACCPACTGTGCRSGVLSPGQTEEEKRHPNRPPDRKRRKGRGKERKSGKTRTPKEKRPQRKTPRRSPTKVKTKHYTPTRKPSPKKRTNIPPKFSPQNSVNRYP